MRRSVHARHSAPPYPTHPASRTSARVTCPPTQHRSERQRWRSRGRSKPVSRCQPSAYLYSAFRRARIIDVSPRGPMPANTHSPKSKSKAEILLAKKDGSDVQHGSGSDVTVTGRRQIRCGKLLCRNFRINKYAAHNCFYWEEMLRRMVIIDVALYLVP